eukprot:328956-Rhodomonas_salina.1
MEDQTTCSEITSVLRRREAVPKGRWEKRRIKRGETTLVHEKARSIARAEGHWICEARISQLLVTSAKRTPQGVHGDGGKVVGQDDDVNLVRVVVAAGDGGWHGKLQTHIPQRKHLRFDWATSPERVSPAWQRDWYADDRNGNMYYFNMCGDAND